jgi:exoribonuclease-2
MNVFYEEEGELRAGTVLADNTSSLQVEAPHGRRSKVKATHVLLRFEQPGARALLDAARSLADTLDAGFLWEVVAEDEFGFESLAREYFGGTPDPVQCAALLLRLHASPMYFYRRGRGLYRRAPEDSLKAALAGVERRRREAEQQKAWVDELCAGRLPEGWAAQVPMLLYAPERQSLQVKALEAACAASGLSAPRLLARAGALASPHDYHFGRFLHEHFRHGTGFAVEGPLAEHPDLPQAPVVAWSIDDAATTEIDDALSVERIAGGYRIGVHIAAPALGIAAGSPLDAVALSRLSTAYFPGRKITMLPEPVIERYSLAAGQVVPAVSLYAEVDEDFAIRSTRTAVERVQIGGNLRLDALEPCFTPEALAAAGARAVPALDHPQGFELWTLWGFAQRLLASRGKQPEAPGRVEYSFIVEGDRVRLRPRPRGSPLDTLVAELMIFANSRWGGELAGAQVPAIYRAQAGGKVHMTTVPSPHQGLGVAHYTWASSPLRRMVDLVNQRQIIAWALGEPPPHEAGGESLLAAMRAFELAHDAYGEAQRQMERYWSLRWIEQESLAEIDGEVIRENLVRLEGVPLVVRVPSLPERASGERVRLAVERIDLFSLDIGLGWKAPPPA